MANYEISSGYVGSMGQTWRPCPENEVAGILTQAAALNKMDEAELVRLLNDGRGAAADYAQGANYFCDHGMKKIRSAVRPAPPVRKMVKCSCGHTVPAGSVMYASMGTSCPDCYDRMSE